MKAPLRTILLIAVCTYAGVWVMTAGGKWQPSADVADAARKVAPSYPTSEQSVPVAHATPGQALSVPVDKVRAETLTAELPARSPCMAFYPQARVLEERTVLFSDTEVRRTRLLKPQRGERTLLTVEDWEWQAGAWVLRREEVMVADHVLVSLGDAGQAELVRRALSRSGYEVESTPSPFLLMVQLGQPSLGGVPDAVAELGKHLSPGSTVEPDYLYFPTSRPDDPGLQRQYAHALMQTYEAWESGPGGHDVVIAVLDSGIDPEHEDLAENLWSNPDEIPGNGIDDDQNGYIDDVHGWDFYDNDGSLSDSLGHGTHVAGIAGAVGGNGLGGSGVCAEASMIGLRCGDQSLSASQAILALDYIYQLKVNQGVNVVASNNSYGTVSNSDALRAAIVRQRNAGILFVTSAGNATQDNDATPFYPASYGLENIIAVANSDSADNLAPDSNYGLGSVHLSAPGVDIYSTLPGGGYGYDSGTSMATPQVTGAIALAYALVPGLSWQQVRAALLESVDPIPSHAGKTVTGGRLNVYAMLLELADDQEMHISSPAFAVQLFSAQHALICEAEVRRDGLVASPDSPVQWRVSPSSGVVVEQLGDSRARLSFPAHGVYAVTATMRSGGIQKMDTRSVVVGSVDSVLDEALLARWDFEGAGDGVTDGSGNGWQGTLLGGAGREPGMVGDAYRGDGTAGSRVEVTGLPSMPVTTIAAWVKSEPLGPDDTSFPRVFESEEYTFFLGFDEGAGNANNLKFLAQRDQIESIWFTKKGTIHPGEWNHVAVSFDQSRGLPMLYINGEYQPASLQSEGLGDFISQASDVSLGNNAAGSRGLNGLLDAYSLYSRELSEEEIRLLAALPSLSVAPEVGELSSQLAPLGQAWSPLVEVNHAEGPLSYQWEVVSGTEAVLDDADSPLPSLTFLAAGSVRLRLSVSHGSVTVCREWSISTGGELPHIRISNLDTKLLGEAGAVAQIRIETNGAIPEPLHLSYQTTGSAVPGVHYEALDGALLLEPGASSATISVHALALRSGQARTLVLTLDAGAGYALEGAPSVQVRLLPCTFENWSSHYQAMSGSSGSSWRANADANANGTSNLVEYALGLSPLAVDMVELRRRLPRVAVNEQGQLTLTYIRPEGVPASCYQVGYSMSPNGDDFTPLAATGDVVVNGDGTETVTVTDSGPLSAPQTRFLRLRVVEH